MKNLLYLRDDQIKDFIENLFYAYRETFNDPKKILEEYSLGIAHLKSLNLISRYKGITISQLLTKLKITKQSLNRVLNDLEKNEIIFYEYDKKDSRVKHVFLKDKGKNLSDKIFSEQKKRVYRALKNSNSEAVQNFDKIITEIING